MGGSADAPLLKGLPPPATALTGAKITSYLTRKNRYSPVPCKSGSENPLRGYDDSAGYTLSKGGAGTQLQLFEYPSAATASQTAATLSASFTAGCSVPWTDAYDAVYDVKETEGRFQFHLVKKSDGTRGDTGWQRIQTAGPYVLGILCRVSDSECQALEALAIDHLTKFAG